MKNDRNGKKKITASKPETKPISSIKEKSSPVEDVFKRGDSELIAKAIRNILKKDEN